MPKNPHTPAVPRVTKSVVEYLEHMFPDRAVDPRSEDPAAAHGSALVVRHLRHIHETQEAEGYIGDVFT